MFPFSRKASRPPAAAIPQQQTSSPTTALLSQLPLPGAQPELAPRLQPTYTDVGAWPQQGQQLPIVYSPRYNIKLFGLERLHPFDSCKFEKVVDGLVGRGIVSGPRQLVQPQAVSKEVLSQVHSQQYLQQLHSSSLKAAQVTELAPLAVLPMFLIDRQVLQPMRVHVGGTCLAAALAVTHGWAINLGGGMHHAHFHDGAGWCPYADITLAVHMLRAASGGAVQRVLVVDLDVHQGNGVERDRLHWQDNDMCILDMYNARTFPLDREAKAGIDVKVELQPGTADEDYLQKLEQALQAAAAAMPSPHLIIYNAGTDILTGDPLGRLQVSAEGVAQRDAAVWAFARQLQAPIVMLLSGGYTRASAAVIVDSIAGLLQGVAGQQQHPGATSRRV